MHDLNPAVNYGAPDMEAGHAVELADIPWNSDPTWYLHSPERGIVDLTFHGSPEVLTEL